MLELFLVLEFLCVYCSGLKVASFIITVILKLLGTYGGKELL